MVTPKYKRILLKLSGEALANGGKNILDFDFIAKVAEVLVRLRKAGVEIGVIVGAGNIWRGRQGTEMDRQQADNMGMLATAINALALQDSFARAGLDAVVMSAAPMPKFADSFSVRGANEALANGKVVVFACGLGDPFFSTDTAAALRAAEIGADVVLMAKNIDGIYTADPKIDPNARRYDEVTYAEVLEKQLTALDLSATTFCMENDIRCYAFALNDPDNIYRAVMGEHIGTELHR